MYFGLVSDHFGVCMRCWFFGALVELRNSDSRGAIAWSFVSWVGSSSRSCRSYHVRG